jgi:hypothetical protein
MAALEQVAAAIMSRSVGSKVLEMFIAKATALDQPSATISAALVKALAEGPTVRILKYVVLVSDWRRWQSVFVSGQSRQ